MSYENIRNQNKQKVNNSTVNIFDMNQSNNKLKIQLNEQSNFNHIQLLVELLDNRVLDI